MTKKSNKTKNNTEKKGRKRGRPTKKEVRYRNSGRKLFDGKNKEIVIAKLESAFSIGCTDKEACISAGISEDALYRYMKKNKKFSERKELLKDRPILASRSVVIKAIQETEMYSVTNSEGKKITVSKPTAKALETAWKYLERKRKNEFSPHSTFSGVIDTPLSDDRKKEIDDVMKKWYSKIDNDVN